MAIDYAQDVNVQNIEDPVRKLLARYRHALSIKDQWLSTFEECYEYALPQRESFYHESIGRRRTDHIFDETAVVGVQEFASRLQAGIVPSYARWADFIAGSEIPVDDRKEVNEALDEVTEYVFEILQNSNFAQEVHETFLDIALGTGVLMVEEGDATQPIRFQALPLPQVTLAAGHDDKIDHVFRKRRIRMKELEIAYPNANMSDNMKQAFVKNPDKECDIIEVIYRNWTNKKEEEYVFCAISEEFDHKIYEEVYKGQGSNPYIVYRW